jgi:hypothetical protein
VLSGAGPHAIQLLLLHCRPVPSFLPCGQRRANADRGAEKRTRRTTEGQQRQRATERRLGVHRSSAFLLPLPPVFPLPSLPPPVTEAQRSQTGIPAKTEGREGRRRNTHRGARIGMAFARVACTSRLRWWLPALLRPAANPVSQAERQRQQAMQTPPHTHARARMDSTSIHRSVRLRVRLWFSLCRLCRVSDSFCCLSLRAD